jgi:hypothetical protein
MEALGGERRYSSYSFLTSALDWAHVVHNDMFQTSNGTCISVEKFSSWEANSCSASQEIPHFLFNPKTYYCVHRTPPLVPILSRMVPWPSLLRIVGRCSTRDQTMCFAYVTSLRVERKQTHILCKPKTSRTQELRQRDTKYCRWEIMFIVRTVCGSLYAIPPNPPHTLVFYF